MGGMEYTFKILCLVLVLSTECLTARVRPRIRQEDEELYQSQDRAAEDQVVLVAADQYEQLYRAADRLDDAEYETRAPAQHHRSPARALKEAPKQPPVQTIRNYNKVNDDGSFTFGYEAADGSFKEETRGTDCVVRGKYGYVDPDGNKREFTYVSGNPCDPNAPDDEESEAGAPESAERDDEPANYPTRPALRPTTSRPPTTVFQNDFRDADEDEVEEEPLQHIKQRIVQRPISRPRPYQPQHIAITPRPVAVTTARALPPATTFRPQLLQITQKPISYTATPTYTANPASAIVSSARPSQIDFAAEFAKFQNENQVAQSHQSTTLSPSSRPVTSVAPAHTSNPIYSTELIFDPSSGSYDTQLYQTLPQTKGGLNLNQKLQPYVAQPQPRPFVPSLQINSPASQAQQPLFRHQIQHANPQEIYQRQQAESQFQSSAQLFAQQQQLQQSQLQRDRAAARAQAQRLTQGPQQSQAQQRPQYYFVAPRGDAPSGGQIDAFLRSHGIQF